MLILTFDLDTVPLLLADAFGFISFACCGCSLMLHALKRSSSVLFGHYCCWQFCPCRFVCWLSVIMFIHNKQWYLHPELLLLLECLVQEPEGTSGLLLARQDSAEIHQRSVGHLTISDWIFTPGNIYQMLFVPSDDVVVHRCLSNHMQSAAVNHD